MSLESTLTRIGQIESMFTPTPATAPASGSASATGGATSSTSFATALEQASQSTLGGSGEDTAGTTAPSTAALLGSLAGAAPAAGTTGLSAAGSYAPAYAPTGATTGAGDPALVNIAATQIGQAEQPNGSNDGPAIATYRTATAGAMAGEPWCAYFVSWAARQAGTPLGDQGQGFGAVSQIWSWAQEHGRAVTNGPGVVPKPGDLIVFGGAHVGIVDKVLPNGDIQTIEGNYSNKVSQVVRSPTEATGYVSMS